MATTGVAMEMCEKTAEEIADRKLKEWPVFSVKEHHFQDTFSSNKTGECGEHKGMWKVVRPSASLRLSAQGPFQCKSRQ